MKLINWLGSSAGRVARMVAGVVLLVLGVVAGGGWIALSIVGIIPLVAGIADVCLLAALFGRPLQGHRH